MKKYINLILIICLSLLLAGCRESKNVLKCSSLSKQSNYSIKTNYEIESSKDIVEKVIIEQIIESNDSNILDEFKRQFLEQYKANNISYGGYKYSVKIKENKLTAKIDIDYDKVDMQKFIKDNGAMKDYVNKKNQFTLNSAKKLYQSTGAKCE